MCIRDRYVPVEFAAGVYDDLIDAGAALGAVPAGYYTCLLYTSRCV